MILIPPILCIFEGMRMLLLSILFLCSTGLMAQRQYQYFYGTVTDPETRQTLPGVNLTFEGLKQGYVTDAKGAFSFFLDTIPVYMVVSSMGYETKKIWLDGTSPKLSIRLTPALLTLPEIEIVARSKAEPFFRDAAYAVLDYAVDSGGVFLLIYRFTLAESEVLYKTHDQLSVAGSGTLWFRPDSLFRDCLGNLHVMGHDSCYQLFADTAQVRLLYPVETERFRQLLQQCVASTETKLFFRKETLDGFGIDFYRVDRETHVNEKVASVVDEETLARLRANQDDYGRIRSDKIPDGRSEFQAWSFARKVMYKPRTAVMVQIGEHICIFNTADMTIEFYTPDGDFTSKVKFDVSQISAGRWTREIYVDGKTSKAYTSFIRNGEMTLYRVNPETGVLYRSCRLTHGYPQRIRVCGGAVYYMYNVPGEPDNKQVFRQEF